MVLVSENRKNGGHRHAGGSPADTSPIPSTPWKQRPMTAGLLRVLREPLLHFFVLGAGIFLLFGLVGDPDEDKSQVIKVSAARIERLVEGWKKTRMRAPTLAELEGLIEDHVREEVYYREALAMGLDRDDMVIRRRLRQKMEFLSHDLTAERQPTEPELQAFLRENPTRFRIEPRISFDQVYVSRDRRGDLAERHARKLLRTLRVNDVAVDMEPLGDPLPLPRAYESLTASEIRSLFGADFATGLLSLEPGAWEGPVTSGYGLHLVLVRRRTEPRMPDLAEVRDVVEREWREARRRAANEEIYRRIRERYSVVIERPRWLDEDVALGEERQ